MYVYGSAVLRDFHLAFVLRLFVTFFYLFETGAINWTFDSRQPVHCLLNFNFMLPSFESL
jgi:hypothetical protein